MRIDITTLGRLSVRKDGRELPGFSAQPVRTALLVHLAVEGETTRDAVTTMLWPESDDRRARHALSQTLYALKQVLGEGWVESRGPLLRVADAVTVDTARLERAVEEGDHERAIAAYGGRFLDGWHLKASSEFEQWVDGQRDHCARLYREASREHAEACLRAGDPGAAVAAARAWAEREPLDPDAQHLLLRTLVETGDPRTALRQYRVYERRLRSEELDPLPETRRLLEHIQLQARAEAPPAPPAAGPRRPEARLAVLPFRHHGLEEDRYFTEGFTDELTNELARVPGIAVTARTSSMQYEAGGSLAQIGAELGVDHVVRGSIHREASAMPARIRINVALVRIGDGTQLWGDSYHVELTSGFDVEAEVAERITETLGFTGVAGYEAARSRSTSRSREAFELYLKGVQYANSRSKEGLDTAAAMFQEALALQPDFARAYAGLGQLYALVPGFTGAQPRVWYTKAERAAERALALDPDLAEAHVAMSLVKFHLAWDLPAAEHHLNRCLEIAPSYALAWVRLGYVLCTLGRNDAARRAAETGLALDPLSVATNFDTGFQFWQLRDRESALRQFRRVQQLDPNFEPAHFFLAADHFTRGEIDDARREWSRLKQPGPLWHTVVARLHRPEEAIDAMERLTALAPGPVNFLMASALHTLLGAHDRALDWLEGHARNVRGESGRLETGGPSLTHVARDPLFDPLRGEERFRALMRRMNLEDRVYEQTHEPQQV